MTIPPDQHDARKQVLLADDDATMRLFAHSHLVASGFDVIEARDGAEALGIFETQPIDAVVLDIMMPVMNGYDVCSRIRQSPRGRLTPILMITGMDDIASIHRAYECGATEFSMKPVVWTAETHRLRYMLRSAEAMAGIERAERQVRSAHDEWVRTFDSIKDIVMILDRDLRIVRMNNAARKAFMHPGDNPWGAPCHDVLCDDTAGCATCPNRLCLADGSARTIEMEYHGLGTFRVSASPLRSESGLVTGVVHLACDITEQRQLEKHLRHTQKMETVGLLAGGVAHDFNNVLQAIQGFAELLRPATAPDTSRQENVSEILRAASRGRELVRQLLTFGRKTEPSKLIIDLDNELSGLRAFMEHALPKAVKLTIATSLTPTLVEADPAQLSQILMNLTTNAGHAMHDGGELSVSTCRVTVTAADCQGHPDKAPGDYACLTVSDTGHGMDSATLAHAFEPFFTTKPVGEGTGLGLAVVYSIVRSHGGFITCDSKPGHGTTFKIYLPASNRTIPIRTGEAAPELPAGRGETILIVDDEPALRKLGEIFLSTVGYRVLTAPDGESALSTMQRLSRMPELVILDLNMPGMGGERCLEHLSRDFASAKVLIASGYTQGITREVLLAKGAADVIGKPYTTEELQEAVYALLQPMTPAINAVAHDQ